MPSKLDSIKSMLKAFLKSKKKNILSFFVTFILLVFGLLCCSLSSLSLTNYHESIARRMGNKTYVCEIKSNNENETYRQFFSYADDMAGAEIKKSVNSFILCEEKDGNCPSEFIISPSSSVEIHSIFQQTNWRLDLLDYGFKTLTGSPIINMGVNDIYIDSLIALDLASALGCDEADLVGMNLDIKTKSSYKNIRILDIIVNFSNLDFGPYFPNGTIITSFSNTATWFENSKYVLVLGGDYLSKNYQIKFIDSAIKRLGKKETKYVDSYFKLVNKKLIDDGIQKLMENTKSFYHRQNKQFGFFFIMPVLTLAIIGVLSLFKFIGKEFYLSLVSASFIYVLVTSKFLPYVVIKDSIILIANSSAPVFILCFMILSICAYLLFEPNDKNGKEKKKGMVE